MHYLGEFLLLIAQLMRSKFTERTFDAIFVTEHKIDVVFATEHKKEAIFIY